MTCGCFLAVTVPPLAPLSSEELEKVAEAMVAEIERNGIDMRELARTAFDCLSNLRSGS
jgi:hypothetical protein